MESYKFDHLPDKYFSTKQILPQTFCQPYVQSDRVHTRLSQQGPEEAADSNQHDGLLPSRRPVATEGHKKATRSSAMFKRHLTAWRLNTTVPLRHRTESYFTSCLHITKQLTSRQISPKGRLIFYYLNNLCFLVFYPTCFYISLRHTRLSQDV